MPCDVPGQHAGESPALRHLAESASLDSSQVLGRLVVRPAEMATRARFRCDRLPRASRTQRPAPRRPRPPRPAATAWPDHVPAHRRYRAAPSSPLVDPGPDMTVRPAPSAAMASTQESLTDAPTAWIHAPSRIDDGAVVDHCCRRDRDDLRALDREAYVRPAGAAPPVMSERERERDQVIRSPLK